MRFDFHPILERKFHTRRVSFPHHAAQGGARVLEREIQMSRGGPRKIGQFAAHPDILQDRIGFENLSKMRGEARHRPLDGSEEGRLSHKCEDTPIQGMRVG